MLFTISKPKNPIQSTRSSNLEIENYSRQVRSGGFPSPFDTEKTVPVPDRKNVRINHFLLAIIQIYSNEIPRIDSLTRQG